MAANGLPQFDFQFFDNTGTAPVVAAGYVLYQYVSGTTTNQSTYTDAAGTIANSNPLTLDSNGRCAMFGGAGLTYTFVLKTGVGGTTIKTWDGVATIPSASATSYLPLTGGTMTGAITLSANATSSLHAVPLQQVNSLIATASAATLAAIPAGAPIGSVSLWLTGSPPTNYMELKGTAISRTTYATLFALWGTTFGSGDGSTTFNLPEVRGEFPRFWDNSRGVDTGRSIGSAQSADIAAHTHAFTVNALNSDSQGQGVITGGASNTGGTADGTFSGTTSASSGTETRPRNFTFMAIARVL